MRLGPFSLSLTSLVLLLSCNPGVNANFDLYSGFGNLAIPTQPHYARLWWIFDGEPSCDDAWGANQHGDTDDVSGTKTGVRCEGGGCSGTTDPALIDVVEMHFTNNPRYHWTIYKNRGNYDMIGLDGRVYGNCDPFSGDDFFCTTVVSTISAQRKFRCHTQFTAGQISAANRLGLTLDEAAAKYDIAGWDPVVSENDSE